MNIKHLVLILFFAFRLFESSAAASAPNTMIEYASDEDDEKPKYLITRASEMNLEKPFEWEDWKWIETHFFNKTVVFSLWWHKHLKVLSFSLTSESPENFESIIHPQGTGEILFGPDIYFNNDYITILKQIADRTVQRLSLISANVTATQERYYKDAIENILDYKKWYTEKQRSDLEHRDRVLCWSKKHRAWGLHQKAPNPLLAHRLALLMLPPKPRH